MRRVLLVIGIILLAACSSSHKKASPTTSTTASTASTSSSVPSSSPTTGGSVTPTTAPTTPTTTSGGGGSNVRVIGPKGPSNPVECNAQTTIIELTWTTSGATNVEMRIDGGPVFARYKNGDHTEMLPLTCDGKAHKYELTATAGGTRASQSITLQTKRTA
jgi:hypothetical protein